MPKGISTVFLVLLGLHPNVFSQDMVKMAEDKDSKADIKVYSIKSLEGQDRKVYIMPDYFHHTLKMSCLQDTIALTDYWGVPPNVTILNNSFIKINYEVRGGSGVGSGNLLILCVSGNKLYQAMHVVSHANSESGEERDNYDISVALKAGPKNNYQLNAAIHDKVWSRRAPEADYDYHNLTTLYFDANRHVFYSVKENIYGSFIVDDSQKGKIRKQKIGGNYPVIILGKEDYYFIHGRWYEKDDDTNEYFLFK